MRSHRERWLAALALSGALVACRADAPAREPALTSSFEPIPDVELTTQDGRHVRFYDELVRDHVVVVQFFFVHCEGVCPISTGKLVAMQAALGERLGRDIRFLSITLDPERDTPAVLAEHARAVGARPGWTFLTGAQDDIEVLRRRLGVFDIDPVIDADRDQHAGVLVFGNDKKQRWVMQQAGLATSFLTQTLLRLAEPVH